MVATRKGHVDSAVQDNSDGMRYRIPFNVAYDGNTVELNIEQAQYGKAAADYQATLQFLEQRVSSIRRALKGD
jgi:flagellar basal-body rod protein FlgB